MSIFEGKGCAIGNSITFYVYGEEGPIFWYEVQVSGDFFDFLGCEDNGYGSFVSSRFSHIRIFF